MRIDKHDFCRKITSDMTYKNFDIRYNKYVVKIYQEYIAHK